MNYPFGSIGTRLDGDISRKPITNFNINPFIIRQNVINKKYYLTFQNRCYTSEVYPGILKVDIPTLRKKLEDWLKPSDRKYIKLVDCDTNKSTFYFDIEEWINDGLKNCKPFLELGCFSKSYRLSVPLPFMFRTNGLSMLYEKFICDSFKDMVQKNSKLRKDIFSIVEDVSNKILGPSGLSMFEYRYDRMSNSVTVSLKPSYIAGIMAAASLISKSKKTSKRKDFDQLVKKYGKFLK